MSDGKYKPINEGGVFTECFNWKSASKWSDLEVAVMITFCYEMANRSDMSKDKQIFALREFLGRVQFMDEKTCNAFRDSVVRNSYDDAIEHSVEASMEFAKMSTMPSGLSGIVEAIKSAMSSAGAKLSMTPEEYEKYSNMYNGEQGDTCNCPGCNYRRDNGGLEPGRDARLGLEPNTGKESKQPCEPVNESEYDNQIVDNLMEFLKRGEK